MVISDCTVGMGITGSFCSFEKTKDVAKRLVDSFTHVTPVYSYNAQMMNTRFGKVGDFAAKRTSVSTMPFASFAAVLPVHG